MVPGAAALPHLHRIGLSPPPTLTATSPALVSASGPHGIFLGVRMTVSAMDSSSGISFRLHCGIFRPMALTRLPASGLAGRVGVGGGVPSLPNAEVYILSLKTTSSGRCSAPAPPGCIFSSPVHALWGSNQRPPSLRAGEGILREKHEAPYPEAIFLRLL